MRRCRSCRKASKSVAREQNQGANVNRGGSVGEAKRQENLNVIKTNNRNTASAIEEPLDPDPGTMGHSDRFIQTLDLIVY